MPRWLRNLIIIGIVVGVASNPDLAFTIASKIATALGEGALWFFGKLADLATRITDGLS